MMITSIAGFTPARTQNFGAKPTHDINDYLKKIPADGFQKTYTSKLTYEVSKPVKTKGEIVWTSDHLDSLQERRDELGGQVNREIIKYGHAKDETLRAYNRYDYILKQVQANGRFTETPGMFYK